MYMIFFHCPLKFSSKPTVHNGAKTIDDGEDSVTTDMLKSTDSTNSKPYEDVVPPLPPKRMRRNSSDSSSHDSDTVSKVAPVNTKIISSSQDGNAFTEDCGNNFKDLLDGKNKQEHCTMTMKDGAIVTNFSEKLK